MTRFGYVALVLIAAASARADDSQQQIEHSQVLGKPIAVFDQLCAQVGGKQERLSSEDFVCHLRRMETIACATSGGGTCKTVSYVWPYLNEDVANMAVRRHGEPDKTLRDDGNGCAWVMWARAAVKMCPSQTHYMRR